MRFIANITRLTRRTSLFHSISFASAFALGSAMVVFMTSFAVQANAQSDQAKPSTGKINPAGLLQPILDSDALLPSKEQAKITRAIFNATKNAKTGKDFTRFIAQCDAALDNQLSKANQAYVISLKGWAFNRRGELRLEVAKQLKAIGSVDQYLKAFQAAIADFDSALINAPQRERSWNARGIAHSVEQDWAKAIADFTEATKLKPDYSTAWFNRAEAFYASDRFELAEKDYDTVIRMQNDDSEALTGRALSRLANNKFNAAIEDFNIVIRLNPKNGLPLINRGDAYLSASQWTKALTDFKAAKAIVTDEKSIAAKAKSDLVADQRMAWLMATCPDSSIQNAAKSVALIESIIAKDGESLVRLETLAAAQAAAGQFDSARKNQKNAIRLVGAEELDGENPSKIRLSLYEEDKPFRQTPAETKREAPKK